ncbi:MAG: homoserine kinase [Acidobacteria bacterium]|nr:MAG: homoserine kinase [Acidobacteriota bacterium]PYQ85409.1 MAG: homoserine kinase [Acidobacteriota bacterium]PYQ89525.1 MAG: homoserine kinase [Acidobacteriota bacterium]PYR09850.1 MAG: homoserine kinase [Acidobacteriota bacterium]
MDSVTAFAPATVSNVACGFDVLGFALETPGDEVTARRAAGGVRIADITGDAGRLPREASRNSAGVAAQALLRAAGENGGVDLTIAKGLPLSSGLGGSAASAVAAVVAVDALIGARLPIDTLLACAFEGERLGAGSAHADNIAPCLYGGFVLVRRASPPDIVRLPVPHGLTAVVVHPDLEIETAKARALLGDSVPLADAIRQWANLGAFVDALHRGDFALLSRSLEDAIAEPRRAPLVPGLAAIKQAATDAGALGCSLSGSGPSLFALCRGLETAERVAASMAHAVKQHIGGAPQTYISTIAPHGAQVIAPADPKGPAVRV